MEAYIDFMIYLKVVFYALCLFFILYTPLITFGQQDNSTIANNPTTNTSNSFDLSGLYISDNQDKYFLRQVGNSLWWIGTDKDGSHVINIFKGIKDGNNITGQWIDSPLEKKIGYGSLNLILLSNSTENITLVKVPSKDKFPINQLIKFNPETQVIPKFMVMLNGVNVDIPRSPIHDVLYVGLGVKKDSDTPLTATRYLANSEGSSNITLDLKLGPFELDKKDDGLTIVFMGVNKEDSRTTPILISLGETLVQLFDPSFDFYSLSNMYQTNLLMRSLSPGLLSGGCNGLVFADKIFLPFEELKKSISNGIYSQEKSYLGTESPSGCGPNSKYQVKWSVVPVE